MKHTGQESGGDLCEMFKFRSFLQSKSVNNVCSLHTVSASGDFVLQIPCAMALELLGVRAGDSVLGDHFYQSAANAQ